MGSYCGITREKRFFYGVLFVGTIDWNTVESCPTFFGVEDAELKELADALKILHVYCDNKDWSEDDFISVFEELTGLFTASLTLCILISFELLLKTYHSFNHVLGVVVFRNNIPFR